MRLDQMSSKFSQVNGVSQPSKGANEKRVTKGKSKGNDQHTISYLLQLSQFRMMSLPLRSVLIPLKSLTAKVEVVISLNKSLRARYQELS